MLNRRELLKSVPAIAVVGLFPSVSESSKESDFLDYCLDTVKRILKTVSYKYKQLKSSPGLYTLDSSLIDFRFEVAENEFRLGVIGTDTNEIGGLCYRFIPSFAVMEELRVRVNELVVSQYNQIVAESGPSFPGRVMCWPLHFRYVLPARYIKEIPTTAFGDHISAQIKVLKRISTVDDCTIELSGWNGTGEIKAKQIYKKR